MANRLPACDVAASPRHHGQQSAIGPQRRRRRCLFSSFSAQHFVCQPTGTSPRQTLIDSSITTTECFRPVSARDWFHAADFAPLREGALIPLRRHASGKSPTRCLSWNVTNVPSPHAHKPTAPSVSPLPPAIGRTSVATSFHRCRLSALCSHPCQPSGRSMH